MDRELCIEVSGFRIQVSRIDPEPPAATSEPVPSNSLESSTSSFEFVGTPPPFLAFLLHRSSCFSSLPLAGLRAPVAPFFGHKCGLALSCQAPCQIPLLSRPFSQLSLSGPPDQWSSRALVCPRRLQALLLPLASFLASARARVPLAGPLEAKVRPRGGLYGPS